MVHLPPPLSVLQENAKEGLLSIKHHPVFDELIKVSYTKKAVPYLPMDPVLRSQRGHVYQVNNDKIVRIVARPFEKFFNLNENSLAAEHQFDWSTAFITRKYDGVMIMVFWYKDRLIYSTRGSWGADEAYKQHDDYDFIGNAVRIAKEKGYDEAMRRYMKLERMFSIKNLCFIFELITPEYRIIEPYEEEDLVLLAIRSPGYTLKLPPKESGFRVTDVISGIDFFVDPLTFLKAEQRSDSIEEGYVVIVKEKRGGISYVKVKRNKYVELVALHRRYKFSEKHLLKLLRTGGINNLHQYFEELPEQIKDDVYPIYSSIVTIARNNLEILVAFLQENWQMHELPDPKEFATKQGLSDEIKHGFGFYYIRSHPNWMVYLFIFATKKYYGRQRK